jgi:hypothetical protein
MSLNQLYDSLPDQALASLEVGSITNFKCNQWRCKKLKATDVALTTINGAPYIPVAPGINGQFYKTSGGVPSWEYFSLSAFSPTLGPAKSLLSVDQFGFAAEWSKDLDLLSVVVDDINIENSVKINSVLPAPSQLLGTDSFGQLGWQSLPVAYPASSIYHLFSMVDYNAALSTIIQFEAAPTYDNLVGQITKINAFDFRCDTAGVYSVELVADCVPSSSEVDVGIYVNGSPISYSQLLITTNSIASKAIVSLAVNDIVNIVSNRIGVSAVQKFNLSGGRSSPVSFTRLA